MTTSGNKQPQPQDPTIERERRIMRRIRAQRRAAKREAGSSRGEEGRRSPINLTPVHNYRGEVENGGELGVRGRKRTRQSVGSVGADRGCLSETTSEEAEEREAQDPGDLLNKGKDSMSLLSRPIRGVCIR